MCKKEERLYSGDKVDVQSPCLFCHAHNVSHMMLQRAPETQKENAISSLHQDEREEKWASPKEEMKSSL